MVPMSAGRTALSFRAERVNVVPKVGSQTGDREGPLMTSSIPQRHVLGALALMSAWFLFATGELLYGDLDAMTDPIAIAEASGRFATGAVLQFAAAIMLAVGLVALIAVTRDRTPRLSHAGGFLALAGAVGLGAWAQLHLIVLALSTADLDMGAVTAVLNGPLQDFGLWGIPIMFVLLPLPIGLILLTVGTARAGITNRWAPYAIGFYVAFHLFLPGGGDWTQVISHYLLAAILAWVAFDVLRHPREQPRIATPRRDEVDTVLADGAR
jgi:hypothetical protein